MTALSTQRPSRQFAPALNAMRSALETGINQIDNSGYPPHNIYRIGEDDFFVEMAVAGFSPEDIDVTVEKSVLTIATKSQDDTAPEDEGDRVYLRQGLARRSFRRSYRLGEYIVVRDAKMENGLLRVHLAREIPEDARPRQIAITSAG